MLGKLAYRNTKRNIKDYLIYLITVTASFSLIFAFNLVANSDEIVKLCSSMDAFKNSLFAVNILIIFVICFLINYTTKFMFEKRSKELGTYQVQNFFQSEYYDFDPVLKLSDYNRLLELRKMPLLSLNDNEYYIVTNSKFAYKVEDNKDIETITVANKNLKLKGYDTKSYWNSITNTGRFVVVLPDKYVQGLEVSEKTDNYISKRNSS